MKILNYKFNKKETQGFLQEKFGDHFAQISTDTTLKLRSSVKDVSRVLLGEVPFQIEELTKKFVNVPQGVTDRDHVFGYDNGEGHVAGAIDYDPALREFIRGYPKLWEVVKGCLSLKRGSSRHASAWAIANRPINEFIPTTNITGVKCTQYTAKSVENSGAIKYDFLRVNSLNDISEALKLVQINYEKDIPFKIELDGILVPGNRLLPKDGRFYDIWKLPEDASVFKDIYEGRTETVFQLSTEGATDWLKYFNAKRPDGTPILNSIKDMAIFTALDRPGPLDAFVETEDGLRHNMLVEYTRRVQGLDPAPMPKIFEELLKDTYSILIFQEDVQKLYQEIVGCSNTEAEKFRYNVGKKRKADIEKAYPVFMKAAVQKYGQEEAQKCWDAIQTFSAYGFVKSHSYSYVTTAYACAYLKHHFPLEWWCAVLSNANKDEINETFWQYCGHMIDLPDIQNSSDNFTIKNGRIVAPISLMNGIGETAHKQLCDGLPYVDIKDFCDKIQKHKESTGIIVESIKKKKDRKTKEEILVKESRLKLGHSALNRKVVYTLIISGAMDALFQPELSILEKLAKYEELSSLASGKKAEPIGDNFKEIDDLARFQLRKSILPAYTAPMLPLLKGRYNIKETSNGYTYYDGEWSHKFYSNTSIRSINAKTVIERPFSGVVAAYILSTRNFSYDSGRKNACSVNFDIDGQRYDMVKWPDKFGTLPEHFNSKLDGSIALIFIRKYSPEKSFVIQDIKILSHKIDIKRKEDE